MSSARRALLRAVVPTVTAAAVGNLAVGRDALAWYRGLRQPRVHLPLPAFAAVGAGYYGVLGAVAYRTARRGDDTAYRWALVVLAGNELWNATLFGRRSTRAGFAGMVAFTVPLLALQRSVADDPTTRTVLAPYTAFVLGYDVPWSYRLWRLNP